LKNFTVYEAKDQSKDSEVWELIDDLDIMKILFRLYLEYSRSKFIMFRTMNKSHECPYTHLS